MTTQQWPNHERSFMSTGYYVTAPFLAGDVLEYARRFLGLQKTPNHLYLTCPKTRITFIQREGEEGLEIASTDPRVATLVDAANIILLDDALHVELEQDS